MFKRLSLIALAALLLQLLPATAAQEGLWKAYLFNATSGELVQTNADGSQASYNLGIDNTRGGYTGGSDLAISPDGLRVAYCRMIYSPDPQATPSAELIVHDLVSGQDTLRQPIQALQACRTGSDSFSVDGTQVTVSSVNGFSSGPALSDGVPLWAYQVVDVNSGSVLASLTPDSAPLAGLNWANIEVVLLTERFDVDGIVFNVARWASEGTYGDAYRWNPVDGSVVIAPYWGSLGVDYLPSTGEYAVNVFDPNRPYGEPEGPVPVYNIAQVATPTETRTVFAGGVEWLLLDQVFVNDGRALAMHMLSAFPNTLNAPILTRWALLERDGRLQELFISELFSDLRAIPGGYLLFTQDVLPADGTGATSYSLRLGSGEAIQTIWQSPVANEYQSWELIWTTPYSPASDLPPFTAIP